MRMDSERGKKSLAKLCRLVTEGTRTNSDSASYRGGGVLGREGRGGELMREGHSQLISPTRYYAIGP